MAKQSGYLQRWENETNRLLQATMAITSQYDIDTLQIAIHQYELRENRKGDGHPSQQCNLSAGQDQDGNRAGCAEVLGLGKVAGNGGIMKLGQVVRAM